MRDSTVEDQGVDPTGDLDVAVDERIAPTHAQRGLFALNRSPLTRKVVTFNLIALNVLLSGLLLLLTTQNAAPAARADGMPAQVTTLASPVAA